MLSKTLLVLALALAAHGTSFRRASTTLALSRRFNTTGTQNILAHDLARARYLKRSTGGAENLHVRANEPITNTGVSYVAAVGVGSPPTTYDLLVDTGSANTWIGANKAYRPTSSSIKTKNKVTVATVFSGIEYLDTVALGSDLVIANQSIGVADEVSGSGSLHGADGYLGIGPVDLSVGTLSPDTKATIPTVTDNAFSAGLIKANSVSLSFQPTTSTGNVNGQLSWGEDDNEKYTGSINYVSKTSTSPASQYWGVDLSIRYGSATNIMSTSAGTIDSGTTLIVIATDAFQAYQKATGGIVDDNTGLLTITADQYSNLQSLFFTIGEVTYELTPNAQIWPRSLNSAIGGSNDKIYLVVADMKTTSGQGLDFINGYVFLERFYTVYDTANNRIGFATTPFTDATTN